MATPHTAGQNAGVQGTATRHIARGLAPSADVAAGAPAGIAADRGSVKAPAKRAKRPIVAILGRLTILACAIVVALLAAEVATRLFSSVTPPLLRNHPVLGTTYLPDFSSDIYVPECGREVFLRFNSEGMRGGEVSVEKTPGVRRVAVIGDSFIAAVATDEDKTLVRVVEEQLNAADKSTRWEVINFGISASSTGQELVLYRELVRRYKPDVVVCAFCVMNDLGDNCRRLTSSRTRIYFDLNDAGELVQQPASAKRATLNAWLNRNSRFYVWQRYATQKAIDSVRRRAQTSAVGAWFDLGAIDPGGSGVYETSPEGDLAYAWQVTEKLIETMHDEVRADGAEFLLAVLPAGIQLCDDLWDDSAEKNAATADRSYPDERLSEICGRIGAPILLLTDRFRDASPHHSSEHESEWLHYEAVGHFNDRGNAVAAAALAEALQVRYARSALRNETLLNR